jgi:O-antigen/teichoic acid export membrane protein
MTAVPATEAPPARVARPGGQSLVSLASYVVSLVALTALIPILVRVLGTKTYGAWVLTGGVVSYITLLDFGMSLTIARFVSLAYMQRRREAEQAITVGLSVVTVIGTVAIVVAATVAGAWQHHLGVEGAAFALRAASVALLFLLVSKVLQSALEGAGRVALSRVLQTINTVWYCIAAGIAVFYASNPLKVLSSLLLLNAIVSVLLIGCFLCREWGWHVPLALPDRGTARSVVGYAVAMQGGSIVAFAVDPLSRYILAAAAGPAAVTPLDLALRSSSQWFGAALAFARPVLPGLGHLVAADDVIAERTELLWKRFAEVSLAVGVFLAVLVYSMFPVIFGAVGGHAGRLGAVSVLLWTPSVAAIIPYFYVILYGRAVQVFTIQVVTSGIGMALLLALVWSIGAWAPVLGMGAGSLVGSAVTIYFARRVAGRRTAFPLSRISPRIVLALVVVAALSLTSLPLAIELPVVTILWLALCLPSIRALLRAL